MAEGDRNDASSSVPRAQQSALDVLDLDPSCSLAELVEALSEIAAEGGPRAELARRTFERITERPEAHLEELLRTVPRPDRPRVPAAPAVLAPVGPADLRRSLASRMGPEGDDERRSASSQEKP